MAMLEYQDVIHLRTLPGGVLRQHEWFLAAIATYDFLIAAMIDRLTKSNPPSKDDLLRILMRSHQIRVAITQNSPAAKKAADSFETMLRGIDGAGGMVRTGKDLEEQSLGMSEWQIAGEPAQPTPSASFGSTTSLHFSLNSPDNAAGYWPSPFAPGEPNLSAPGEFVVASSMQLLAPDVSNIDGWLDLGAGLDVDWNTFDSALGSNSHVNFDLLQIPGWGQQGGHPADSVLNFPGPYGPL
ncbi:hypothetical protein B0T14DRAFT_562469 [Immersiella caudata]|uniref:Uncharacterized protein n=1 Tax=Immersiella caudata TaxID=314043 RepID=A0AA39X3F1_9PEZI|nr:hypothetical protein B0T14DRAFT_562469 [Immersiella caudata]